MKTYFILSFIIFLWSCDSQVNKTVPGNCSDLHIDNRSRASDFFVRFRECVKNAGYAFPKRDTSLYPFTKRLFFPPRLTYLQDTLQIQDCSIFDSVNIHYFQLLSTQPSIASGCPEIRLEEEQFKDKISCDIYRKALTSLLKDRNLISKPTLLSQSGKNLYVFQATDFKLTMELIKLSKLLGTSLDNIETNF